MSDSHFLIADFRLAIYAASALFQIRGQASENVRLKCLRLTVNYRNEDFDRR